jgi:hypothetical protein
VSRENPCDGCMFYYSGGYSESVVRTEVEGYQELVYASDITENTSIAEAVSRACVYVYIHIYIYICVCVYVYMCVCIYYVCMYVYTCVCAYVYVCVCMYVCMLVDVCECV